ncbi:MAG: MBL fold metallo-hydrolase [bacterium]
MAILLAREGGEARVLVGRRSARSRFLGGFHAFPGGVYEPADGDLDAEGEATCLRRTAARELREETGIVLDAGSFLPAGRRVTPPFTPLAFDTLMFAAFPPRALPTSAESGELDDLAWERPADLVRRWRALEIRVAPPLLPMLHALAALGPEATADEIARGLAAANTFRDDEGPRIEFVPDVLMLPQRTRTLPPAATTNCYLVGAKEIVIVDPGSDEEIERTRLSRQLDRRAGEGARPVAIVLTHHHGDHVAGVPSLARARGLPLWAHTETLARCGDAVSAASGTRALVEGDMIPLAGGERLRVLHTPGHAVGHVALHEETRGSLFAGDLVSGVSTVLIDAAPGALDAYLASLARLRDLPARTLFPAHGPPMIDPPRALQAVIDHRAAREARILDALADGPRDVAAIVRRAYEDSPNADPSLAAQQALVHLARLESSGRVRRAGGSWALVA